jgi:hypothetical protein
MRGGTEAYDELKPICQLGVSEKGAMHRLEEKDVVTGYGEIWRGWQVQRLVQLCVANSRGQATRRMW